MRSQTDFDQFLISDRFEEAKMLLLEEIGSDRLIDPRLDPYWGRFANRLAGAIDRKCGTVEVVAFWESMRDFFMNRIEPIWGHAHKGHIYFRLGLSLLHTISVGGRRSLRPPTKKTWY